MKCFNHPNVDAVGICKSCGRGLCRECIAEVDLACSCKGRCKVVVETMNDLVERGSTAYQKSSAIQMRNGILIILLGALFLFFGIWGGAETPWNYFFLAAGALFSLLGFSAIFAAIRLNKK